jgi:hypothetical protein
MQPDTRDSAYLWDMLQAAKEHGDIVARERCPCHTLSLMKFR